MPPTSDQIYDKYVSGQQEEAISSWKGLAVGGDVEAMKYLGLVFHEDLNESAQSVDWYQAAISAGDIESMYWIAFPYLKLGYLDKAKMAFESGIQNGLDGAVVGLANFYINELKNLDTAESILQKHTAIGDESASVSLVELYIRVGKINLARELATKLLETSNNKVIASLVAIFQARRDVADWDDLLLVAANSGNVQAQYEMASKLEKLGRLDKLYGVLDGFIAQNNKIQNYSLASLFNSWEWVSKYGYSHSGEYLFTHLANQGNKNSYQQLADAISRDLTKDRKREVLFWLIRAAESGSRPSQEKVCRLALHLDEKEIFETWFRVALMTAKPGQNQQFGRKLTKQKQHEAAIRAYEYEYEHGTKFVAPDLYVALWEAGRLNEAEKFEAGIQKSETNMAGSVALLFMKARNFKQAIRWLSSSNDRDTLKTSINIAHCYWALNEDKNALIFFENAEKQANYAVSDDDSLVLGKMAYRLGLLDLAKNYFSLSTKHLEGVYVPHELLISVMFELGDVEAAGELIERAIHFEGCLLGDYFDDSLSHLNMDPIRIEELISEIKQRYGISRKVEND